MNKENHQKTRKKTGKTLPEKRLTIRNSTAEFLVFTVQAQENGIEGPC